MSTQTLSSADLEQAILAGKKVIADELASAKAREDAAARIAELDRQRRDAEALAERRRKAEEIGRAIIPEFNNLANDKTFERELAALRKAIIGYYDYGLVHNSALTDIRARMQAAQSIEASANIGLSGGADGLTSSDSAETRFLIDWESDIRRAVDAAIAEIKQRPRLEGGH